MRRTSSAIANKYSSFTRTSLPNKLNKNDTSILSSTLNPIRRTSPFAYSPEKNKLMRTNSAENRLNLNSVSSKKSWETKNNLDNFRTSESKFRNSYEYGTLGTSNYMTKFASSKNAFGTDSQLNISDNNSKANSTLSSTLRNSVHMTTVKELAEQETSKLLPLEESSDKTCKFFNLIYSFEF